MRIHFIGDRGVSMSALGEFVRARGHEVTGSDRDGDGHDEKNVRGADLVVYTNAIPKGNCELVYARRHGIPTVERAEYLGELAATYGKVIAVAGCHGKSTTTAMLGDMFGGRATVHVGVSGGSRCGSDEFFITEACEYRESFLHLSPDVGVVLNVQYDHPDYYKDENAIIAAYKAFAGKCRSVIVNGDDEVCRTLAPKAITFGTGANNDFRAVDIKTEGGLYSFTLTDGRMRARIRLPVAGEHNVMNALAALVASRVAGLSLTDAVNGLQKFGGIPRRFERRGIAFGKTVITDYAHHPTEIAATVKCARDIFPSVAVVFQPHTYSRTSSLMDDFVTSLATADTVILAPIYSAREAENGVTSHTLCRKLVTVHERTYCFDTLPEILDCCKTLKEKCIIFMGAGDIDNAANLFTALNRSHCY